MSCPTEYWGMEFSPGEIAACRDRGGLLSLELELSRACNLRCIYCYAESGAALKNELRLDEIYRVIDQARDLGARKIIVLGGGEPLLYPELLKVLDHVLGRGMQADLFTNGTLIDDVMAAELYLRKVAVSMKMNSLGARVQDELAGRAGAMAAIQRGLAALLAAGYPDEAHVLGVESIICGQNYHEIPAMWRWARRNGIVPYFEVMTMQGRATAHPELEVAPARLRILFSELSRIDREEFDRDWYPMPPLAASHCARHEYSCTVTAIGEVQPCPGVSIAVGNVREQALAAILRESQVIRDLREVRRTVKGRCSSCEHNSLCYGCRGHAFQVTGDHLAEDPICWINRDV